MKPVAKRAFTLIELLTVIAITSVLMTIIVYPVFASFNFTRSAQAFADAQARARIIADRVASDIGNSVGLRSSSLLVQTTLNGNPANVPQHALIVTLPRRGFATDPTAGMIEVVLPYVKMDLVKPAEGDPSLKGLNGGYINSTNGFEDPTITSPKGQITLPVGAGATIVRYFVGLHDPTRPYNNPYDGILQGFGGGTDNLYVMYKAEVEPYIYRQKTGDLSSPRMLRPNLAYFQADVTDTKIIDFDDPRFFLMDNADAGKTTRVNNWLGKAQIMSELSRYDMIQPIYNKFSHVAQYDGDAPRVLPLIQFRPSHVSNDPAQGQVAIRQGEESDNAAAIAPDVFRTQFGLWSNQLVRVWPQGWDPNGAPGTFGQYFVGRNDPTNGNVGAPPGFSIYYYDPSASLTDTTTGTEVFDVFTYEGVVTSQGRYPFSQAVTAANNRSGWLANATIRSRFVPFDFNSAKGNVQMGFNISEVGDPNQAPPLLNPLNLPAALTSPVGYGPYTPLNDPNLSGNFYDPAYSTINERFNKVWADNPNLQPQIDRFMDLRVTPQADGSASPLGAFGKARIVPGSEVVYGPDQNPGPHYGMPIRYIRTTRQPGPNQYQINYVDQAEPQNYALLGLTAAQLNGFDPNNYDPHNFCSAIIQPRYKKGYIKFNSDPNVPLPLDPTSGQPTQIQVAYRFQFNGTQTGTAIVGSKSDVVGVDYDTRQLMSVLLTIRNYPQTTNIPNPQTVTLKATAAVRNYIR